MKVKFFGYFEQFRNKDTVRIKVPPKVFANTLTCEDIKTYVVPVGAVWNVEQVDIPNKKIRGNCFVNIAGFEPFPTSHEFDFEEVDINLNRSVTFADEGDDLLEQTADLLRSVLDNLFAYHQARDEIITAMLSTYVKHAPKLKNFAPWVDR